MSTVTVSIACYNHGRFLFDAISSVLAQTRPAASIIVVDDGSSDMTANISALFPTVRYHRQDNAGLSAARNTGLELADTSHILFLDADDKLLPEALERGLALYAQRPELGFAYSGYRDVTVTGDAIANHIAVERPDGFLALLGGNFVAMHGTVIYDTGRLREIGGFDPTLTRCEDWDVYLKIARNWPIAAYPGIAADYRRHGDGMSTNAAEMILLGRAVLARQFASGLTSEQQRRAKDGMRFTTRIYAQRLIGHLRSSLATSLGLLAAGLRHDRFFTVRLFVAGGHAMLRQIGLTNRR